MLFVAFNPDQGFFRSLFSPWGMLFVAFNPDPGFFRSLFSPCVFCFQLFAIPQWLKPESKLA
jgi:hypothetical protein